MGLYGPDSIDIPGRPSQGDGRLYVDGIVGHVTSNQTIHTVTSGKKLYVTSIVFTGFNSSTASTGRIQILDDTTLKEVFSAAKAGTAQVPSMVGPASVVISYLEPKQFIVNLKVAIVNGSWTYSCSFTGYEE